MGRRAGRTILQPAEGRHRKVPFGFPLRWGQMSPLTGLVLNLLMGPPSHGFRRGLGDVARFAGWHPCTATRCPNKECGTCSAPRERARSLRISAFSRGERMSRLVGADEGLLLANVMTPLQKVRSYPGVR